jgi:hypothetical protein
MNRIRNIHLLARILTGIAVAALASGSSAALAVTAPIGGTRVAGVSVVTGWPGNANPATAAARGCHVFRQPSGSWVAACDTGGGTRAQLGALAPPSPADWSRCPLARLVTCGCREPHAAAPGRPWTVPGAIRSAA